MPMAVAEAPAVAVPVPVRAMNATGPAKTTMAETAMTPKATTASTQPPVVYLLDASAFATEHGKCTDKAFAGSARSGCVC